MRFTNHYCIKCTLSSKTFSDNGLILANCEAENPALLRAGYFAKQLTVHANEPGIFRYREWLPVSRAISGGGAPVTYHSKFLAEFLGLERLYISFSGYWPERGCQMLAGTFKECEAYSVCARFPAGTNKVMTVASAGNTARAFIKVASAAKIPLLVVVPEASISELYQLVPPAPWVKIVSSGQGSDYYDAIHLADQICLLDGFVPEGGAKNIARRDGMGTTVLSAVTTAGEIPDYYYQAIGSGTGAIAAYEANLRLIADGRFGSKLMRLRLSQNLPFVPIFNAWRRKDRNIEEIEPDAARKMTGEMYAKVLANRKPPYGIAGGLYDALMATDGDVAAVSAEKAESAQELFAKLEGCDICPEAGVALASLIRDVELRKIDAQDLVMLNITGGGNKLLYRDFEEIIQMKPDLTVLPQNANVDYVNPLMQEIHAEISKSLTS